MRHKVAVFYPGGSLSVSPPTINLVELLARGEFEVDVFAVKNQNFPLHEFGLPQIKMNFMPGTFWSLREPRSKITTMFLAWVMFRIIGRGYGCIIGSGIRGLFAAAAASRLLDIPYVYNCLELYPQEVFSRLFKRWETWAVRRCSLVIIQDELRGKLLLKDTGFQEGKVGYLPNSSLGYASREDSDFLQAKFGISEDKKIVLSAGVFSRLRMQLESVLSAQQWPKDWQLVLHGAQVADVNYVEETRTADRKGRVIFSMNPVPLNQLPSLISSAHVGLALYDGKDSANTEFMGMASGKMAQYLRCGKPVVVSDLPGLGDLVWRYNCGVPIKDPAELESALERVFKNYDIMAANAVECFNQELSLERYVPTLAAKVSGVLEMGYAKSWAR